MTMDREKDRVIELGNAMYTNCLLLSLDPLIIDSTRLVGLFRHSDPKLGKQLLFFILSSLKGPIPSAKDFDKLGPIFESSQSADFRKVVQNITAELEAQGALPRTSSRVSSLVTYCGPRFVELLWQLSLHALQEVHRRAYAADVASNPLPASLTDVAFLHAATLLPVTKARIALERRRFLKNAETAVQRQTMWSNLAHEMTAEFCGLCAEDAYVQQELKKLHDLRNKVKLEGELWDELVSSSSQNSHMVQRATRLWDSLLSRKSQHDVLASGPIEDLIAHRENRYCISGSSLLAAMDQSNQVPAAYPSSARLSDKESTDGEQLNVDDWSGRGGQSTVDIAEVLRRWTHALQHIHKQSLHLAKTNDGEGPELLRSPHDGEASNHAESLATTLTEHRQHLAIIQVLINQLKEVAPAIQSSIANLTEEVNSISTNLPQMTGNGRSTSPVQAHSSGRTLENSMDEVTEMSSKLFNVQLDKLSSSSPALKLPPLFSLTSNSSGKGGNNLKHQTSVQTNLIENVPEHKPLDRFESNSQMNNLLQDKSYVHNLKRSVRETALLAKCSSIESSQDSRSDDSSEHYFVPLSGTGFSRTALETKPPSLMSKRLFVSEANNSVSENHIWSKYSNLPDIPSDLASLDEYDRVSGFLSAVGSTAISDGQMSFYDLDEAQDQVFSPPLLMEASTLTDSYEDLLAPLSEIEAALIVQ